MSRRARATLATVAASGRASLAAALAKPTRANHLGDLTWWIPVAGWRRPVADVESAFAAAGYPAGTLPATPDWSDAFGLAVTAIRPQAKRRGWLIEEKGDGPNGERRFAIAQAQRNGKFSADDLGTVACSRDGHAAPFVEVADPLGICDQILAEARALHSQYTSDHVRAAIVGIFGVYAAQMVKAGFYWLPAAGSSAVESLGRLSDSIGWGTIDQCAIYSTDGGSVTAATRSVNAGLESQLAEFSAAVATYGKSSRVSTIETKIREAKDLRERAALYRTILGAAVESVDERVTAIETSLREALGVVDAARAPTTTNHHARA